MKASVAWYRTSGSMSPQVQGRNQQLPGSAPVRKDTDFREDKDRDESNILKRSNQGGYNLTLKGWPLTLIGFHGV
ncbi:hypothetical protein L6452_23036 [Arctium lappa]|uniref:Uncharacterized protein n=1 Tax=Arctium lappa TaxID=4217 RepID=A0ACB9B2L2_ARCLA|nr:hypothetical protein L6452_23036 [Arctium lappa]